jgi:hypothetical protein
MPYEDFKPRINIHELMDEVLIKWINILEGKGKDLGNDDCKFCHYFLFGGCAKCPIYLYTDKKGCRGTPYSLWSVHQRTIHEHFYNERIEQTGFHEGFIILCNECTQIVEDQIKFLYKIKKALENGDIAEGMYQN